MNKVPLERIECIRLNQWARIKKLPLAHIPNEGKRSDYEGHMLKQMGMVPGIVDYFLALPLHNCHGLWIEMKRQKPAGKKPSDLQVNWLDKMISLNYAGVVSYGWEEAVKLIEEYQKGTLVYPNY